MKNLNNVKEIISCKEDTLEVLDFEGNVILFEREEGIVIGEDFHSEIVRTGDPVRKIEKNGAYKVKNGVLENGTQKIIGKNNQYFIIQPYFREKINDVYEMKICKIDKIKEFTLVKFYNSY